MKIEFKLRGVVFADIETCEQIKDMAPSSQGKTMFLWLRNKRNGKWEIYKRNKHDMSRTADLDGFSRWVSAMPLISPQLHFKEL